MAGEPGTPPPQPIKSPPPGGQPAQGQPPPGQPAQPPPATPLTPKEINDALYGLGMDLGRNISAFGLSKAELQEVIKGMTDEVTEAPNKRVKFDEVRPKLQQLFNDRRLVKSQADIKKGEAYQATAAKEAGAEKTASGLIIKHLTQGKGASPAPTDTVSVHYKGTLIDGTEFDSSYKRNQPAEFPLNGVIPCWTEGVGKMKVGGKAKLTCPYKIAYGEQGRPPQIPGGATLVFEVELLGIKGK
ncbi:MAG: FKBP-type peptidyl-prolyl cis-trans isomerase [Myxococcaceae bacterium]|nr:FKBP-type peptidyl-prolyl cis-trans isomerase [Myxococcaceae bacterium]